MSILIAPGLQGRLVTDAKQAIIVIGNLSDGFTFYGPYRDFDEAAEAEGKLQQAKDIYGSWIATLEPPA